MGGETCRWGAARRRALVMAAEQNIGTERGDPPASPGAATVALVSELTEALTALGNYLASANRLFTTGPLQGPQRLSEALQKSMSQHERAVEATRRLRALSPRPAKDKDLIGYR